MTYQTHDLDVLELDQYTKGLMILPSEIQSGESYVLFRQFIQLLRRAYSTQALNIMADSQGISVTEHTQDAPELVTYKVKIFGMDGSLNTGWLQPVLARHVSVCEKRRVSGRRLVFVTDAVDTVDSFTGQKCKELKVCISTSVFFNDYRVTCGFPASALDQFEQCRNIQLFMQAQVDQLYDSGVTVGVEFVSQQGPLPDSDFNA